MRMIVVRLIEAHVLERICKSFEERARRENKAVNDLKISVF